MFYFVLKVIKIYRLDFLIYINDFPDNLKSTARLFADVWGIHKTGKIADEFDVMQEDLSFKLSQCKWSVITYTNKKSPPDRNLTFCKLRSYLRVEHDDKPRYGMSNVRRQLLNQAQFLLS